jgi:amino-acid N-acetyltransferase
LQWFGKTALLRSVVVAPSARGKGLGQKVVQALEGAAREGNAAQLVLLTLTAKSFFERQGFRVIDRGSVPDDVQASEEFRSLCPGSAICMAKKLAPS